MKRAQKHIAQGKGIFAPKTLSAELAAVCGKKVMPRTEVRAGKAGVLLFPSSGFVAQDILRKVVPSWHGRWMSSAVVLWNLGDEGHLGVHQEEQAQQWYSARRWEFIAGSILNTPGRADPSSVASRATIRNAASFTKISAKSRRAHHQAGRHAEEGAAGCAVTLGFCELQSFQASPPVT